MLGLFKRQTVEEIKAVTLARETQEILRAALPPQQLFNLSDPQPKTYKKLLSQYTNWVYVCASKNASSIASVPLRLYSAKETRPMVRAMGRTRPVSATTKAYLKTKSHLGPIMAGGEVEEIIAHPWLDLIRQVNPFTNGFEMIETTALFLELTGNAYWHLLMGPNDIPIELWTLPSQIMTIKKSIPNGIAYYEFGSHQPLKKLETEEVAHFKYTNPLDLYYGLGPLEASQLPVTLNARFEAYENAVLENGAVIPFFLTTEQTPNEPTMTRLRAAIDKIHKGWKRAGKWGMLTGGLKPVSVGSKPKDVNYAEGSKMTKEQILAAYGIPVSMVSEDGVSRANADVGLRQYGKFTIMPKLKRIEQVINQNIMPLYDQNIFVAFDNPVPEDKEFELKEADSRLANNSMTINEHRVSMGEDSVEWGDEPLVQGDWHNLSDTPDPVVVQPFDNEDLEDEDFEDEEDAKAMRQVIDLRRASKVQTLDDGSPIASVDIQIATSKWLHTTKILVAGNLTSAYISDPSVVDVFIPWHEINSQGVTIMKQPLINVYNDGAGRGITRMRRARITTPEWDIQNPHAIASAEKFAADRVTDIVEDVRKALKDSVAEAIRVGQSQRQLKKKIRETVGLNGRQIRALENFENKLIASGASQKEVAVQVAKEAEKKLRYRAEMIARTETSAAWADGNVASYKEAGVEYKEFSAASDSCEICWPLNGNVYPIGSSEQVIPKHVNCRCDWLPVVESPSIIETPEQVMG